MTGLPQSLMDAVDYVIETSQMRGKHPRNRATPIIADAAKRHLLAEIRALVKPVEETPEMVERVKKSLESASADMGYCPAKVYDRQEYFEHLTEAAIQAMRGK